MRPSETYTLYRGVPPLRVRPFEPDDRDPERIRLAMDGWHNLDLILKPLNRQVEENLRMLCGQQYSVWAPWAQRFIDLGELLGETDELWRHRPVINMLLPAYMLAKARLTENPPIITFTPDTGDEFDSALAEAQDVIFKAKWKEMGMSEVIDRLVSIMHPCGRGYLISSIDWTRGPLAPWVRPARLPIIGMDGQPAVDEFGDLLETEVPEVAFDRQGNPLTVAFADEHGIGYELPDGAVPHATRKGEVVVDAVTPLEVRGTHNETLPWHRKPRHWRRTFMLPEQLWETFGVEVAPDIRGGEASGGRHGPDELAQLMLGSGFYGSASMRAYGLVTGAGTRQDWCTVYEMWEVPNDSVPGMEETLTSPGGRHLVVTPNKVIKDGARPGRFGYTSPIRCFDYVHVPGRPGGTSPQEMMNGLQRAGNHLVGSMLQHADATANPITLINKDTGIGLAEWSPAPGGAYHVKSTPAGIEPIKHITPPSLGAEVHRATDFAFAKIREIGHVDGAQGAPQTRDPSGQVIRELRENSDRPTGTTARSMVSELGRFAEDLMVWMPMIMDEEEVITYAGEDDIVRTLTIQRALFDNGKVHVTPDMESMLPESRSERQRRVRQDWQDGVFGEPASVEARSMYLALARYPNLSKEHLPGGRHRVMANHILGRVMRGEPADAATLLDVYDNTVHIAVIEHLMAGPDFLKLSPDVQAQVQRLRERHKAEIERKQAVALQEQAKQALQVGTVQQQVASALPQPPIPSGAPAPESPTPDPGQTDG